MERMRPACRGAYFGTDQAGPHGPHDYFSHAWAEALPCPGWTSAQSGTGVLLDTLEDLARTWLLARKVPEGVRLECHPYVRYEIQRITIPGYREFCALAEWKPDIPVLVRADMERGAWRIVIVAEELITEGVIRDEGR